jgi:hypothetical protein
MRWKGTSPAPFDKRQGFRDFHRAGLEIPGGGSEQGGGNALLGVAKLMSYRAHFSGVLAVVFLQVLQKGDHPGHIRGFAVIMVVMAAVAPAPFVVVRVIAAFV